MIIKHSDRKGFAIVGCSDESQRISLQEKLDGDKVYKKNQIIVPVKSLPKLLNYKDAIWEGNTKEIAVFIFNNHVKRIQNIIKIKNQYGKEITFDYNLKGIYPALEHQKIMYNVIIYNDCAAILADPGTCKTAAYLWAIDKRIQKRSVKKCLVITLPSLKRNVLEEMSKQVPHLKGVVLDDKSQADKVLNHKYKVDKKNLDYDIYIANYESMFSLCTLFDEDYFDMVVLDEGHRVGSPSSRQTKNIIDKFENTKFKYLITGSLHSNNLMSFFMPFRFLGADTVPICKYEGFRRVHMQAVDVNQYIWRPLPGSEAIVQKIVGNISVYFRKEDCLNLPGITFTTLYCDMSFSQEKVYNEMKEELISSIEDMCKKCNKHSECDMSCENTIEAKNALVVLSKLKQIACGFYINTRYKVDQETGSQVNNSNIIAFDENPKLDLLMQLLTTIPDGKKVIIWSDFTYVIQMIYKRISLAYGEDHILTCYGDQDAFDQVKKFEQPGRTWMVANQKKMGVGLNIQFSNYQVFYSNSYSYIHRSQALGRQDRQGQKEIVTVFDLAVRNSVDVVIMKAVNAKESLSIRLSNIAKVIK